MIEITSNVKHSLGQTEAIHRMRRMVASLAESFPQQVHQVKLLMGDNGIDVGFAAYGYVVNWHADIHDDCVALLGKIPDSAKKFQGKIEQAIVSRVEATLQAGEQARAA